MKPITYLILALLTISFAYGQDAKYAVGVHLSPTVSNVGMNQLFKTSHTVNITSGFTFDFFFTEKFGLSTGLSYEEKSMLRRVTFTDINGSAIGSNDLYNNFHYMILPLMFTYQTGKKTKFYVGAGTFTGLLLGQDEDVIGDSGGAPNITPDEFRLSGDRIDVGLAAAIGLRIPIRDLFLIDVAVREHYGLIASIGGNNGLLESRSNSIGLQLGFKYLLGNRA